MSRCGDVGGDASAVPVAESAVNTSHAMIKGLRALSLPWQQIHNQASPIGACCVVWGYSEGAESFFLIF